MAFNQLSQPGFQPPPQQPTGNGYQIAGQALMQGGDIVSGYASIFEKMVEDRKQKLLEDRKVQWEMEDRQRQEDDRLKKETEETDLKERKRGFAEYLTSPVPEGVDYEDYVLQGRVKYGFTDPDEVIKTKMAPIERQQESDEWDRREGVKQGYSMQLQGLKNSGKIRTKAKTERYKGYEPDQARILQQIDSGALTIDDVSGKIYADLDTMSLDIEMLKRPAADGDIEAKEELKIKIKKRQEMTDFLKTLETWRPERTSPQSPGQGQGAGQGTPPEIQKAIKWLENPTFPAGMKEEEKKKLWEAVSKKVQDAEKSNFSGKGYE